jgi:apolipoprotein N-acyltransferase
MPSMHATLQDSHLIPNSFGVLRFCWLVVNVLFIFAYQQISCFGLSQLRRLGAVVLRIRPLKPCSNASGAFCDSQLISWLHEVFRLCRLLSSYRQIACFGLPLLCQFHCNGSVRESPHWSATVVILSLWGSPDPVHLTPFVGVTGSSPSHSIYTHPLLRLSSCCY